MILGTGVDLIEVSRIKRAFERWEERFERRVFTEREIEYCRRKGATYMAFAARFAAKEAFFKALGTGWSDSMSWREVEVVNTPDGKPEIRLYGMAAEIARRKGVMTIHLSISHDHDHAIAVVLIEG
jgi:holo-[acyl-carrier protein] synthase